MNFVPGTWLGLSGAPGSGDGTFDVNFARTSDGTPTVADHDYNANSGTLHFAARRSATRRYGRGPIRYGDGTRSANDGGLVD
jgi:hypothetical protein